MRVSKISCKKKNSFTSEFCVCSRSVVMSVKERQFKLYVNSLIAEDEEDLLNGSIIFEYDPLVEEMDLGPKGIKWANELINSIWDKDSIETDLPKWFINLLELDS